jgi:ppGpp synthetase/RelA/SpoT-type nucleotidyltranferase
VPDGLPGYSEVMLWYTDMAAVVQQKIASQDWAEILPGRSIEVTSRPKTIDTLRQKLVRDHNTPLPNIQDVAGVRFEAEMSLDEQDLVVSKIVDLFDHDPATSIHDLRENPHSGYRAVHIWLRFDGSVEQLHGPVEVQVRTHLQGQWANMYESAADLLGRGIRYEEMPEDPAIARSVEALKSISIDQIVELESVLNRIAQVRSEIATSHERLTAANAELASQQTTEERRSSVRESLDTAAINLVTIKGLEEQARSMAVDLQTRLRALRDTFQQQRTRMR